MCVLWKLYSFWTSIWLDRIGLCFLHLCWIWSYHGYLSPAGGKPNTVVQLKLVDCFRTESSRRSTMLNVVKFRLLLSSFILRPSVHLSCLIWWSACIPYLFECVFHIFIFFVRLPVACYEYDLAILYYFVDTHSQQPVLMKIKLMMY